MSGIPVRQAIKVVNVMPGTAAVNLEKGDYLEFVKFQYDVVYGEYPEASEEAEEDADLKQLVKEETERVFKCMEDFDVSKSLASIFNIFSKANAYIEKTEPFRLAKDPEKQGRLATVMRNLLECIRIGATLLYPYLPNSAEKVLDALNIEKPFNFDDVRKFYALKKGTVKPLEILFPRLDVPKELEEISKL